MQQRRGSLAKVFWTLILGGALVYGVVLVLDPWAFHIGGRWTPLLTWQGSGKLLTKGGIEYPLWVSFYPSSHFSQLRMDGLRPTGGLQGRGWLCTSRGVTQRLDLSGAIYGRLAQHRRQSDGVSPARTKDYRCWAGAGILRPCGPVARAGTGDG